MFDPVIIACVILPVTAAILGAAIGKALKAVGVDISF
jgi:hypothetical protein